MNAAGEHNLAAATPTPSWVQDVRRTIAVRPQLVLAGNVRDLFLVHRESGSAFLKIDETLWSVLQPMGYGAMVVYDRFGGLSVYPTEAAASLRAAKKLELPDQQQTSLTLSNLLPLMRRLVGQKAPQVALVMDYASRLVARPGALEAEEHRFFAECEKMSHTAHRLMSPGQPPRYNPVFWLVNSERDLPHWFVAGNEKIRVVVVPRPDFETRRVAGVALLSHLDPAMDASRVARFAESFAAHTEDFTLTSMIAVEQLAKAEGLAPADIEDAVLRYKVGVSDNPWKQQHIRERVRTADNTLHRRVKGQSPVIEKTVDILKRSITGLTGAHASRRSGRPRGVLFFAGPTGVGKTELAKALTECLFHDERAYIRFDMSEFRAEHSDARLLGSPPGYVGFDAGGELTNAIRARPFSVVLFDEIEKANGRILDKFLQVLEDGRLTDGGGQTVYFSEAVIIFTSNLGIIAEDDDGRPVEIVKAGTPYDEVVLRVRQAIEHHFKFKLGRPELLNRIGDNIVVFNFIDAGTAAEIFEGMLANVVSRVEAEHGVTLTFAEAVLDQLKCDCTADLQNGGRGIGNALESQFVNPLARALFDRASGSSQSLVVEGVTCRNGRFEVELR